MRTQLFFILALIVGVAPSFAAEVDYSKSPIETLISDIALLDSEGPGLQSTAYWAGFIGDDSPQQFSYGVLGSPRPVVPAQLRELVRRGPQALPALVRHLDDERPTKLVVGSTRNIKNNAGFVFFGGQFFGREYDPKGNVADPISCTPLLSCSEEVTFNDGYTVRVGDVAFGLIGQIVNRSLTPVRYQPTAILIVNSPVESPPLAALVRRDWAGVDAGGLKASLLADLRGEWEERYSPALARLRLYYRDTYDGLEGLDRKKRLAFEREEEWLRQEGSSGISFVASGTLDDLVQGCRTLAACLDALDRGVKKGASHLLDAPAAASRLQAFGKKAKKALLERMTDPDEHWRWVAGQLLGEWRGLSNEDLGPLLEASRMQRGIAASAALAKLGSPEALRVLARHVEIYGDHDVTGDALADVGAKALPYLLPVLMNDDRWKDAAGIIGKMQSRASPGDWGARAVDPQRPIAERIAALRGLAAMGERARRTGDLIAPLLRSRGGKLRLAANEALTKMRYPAVVERDVRDCNRLADEFSSRGPDGGCLGKIAGYGAAASRFGAAIADKFLHSPNGSDRRDAATALGYIGYVAAAPRLIELLTDPDWRVVYASARALGWLGIKAAVPVLERVAQTHWLAEVRDEARLSAAAMVSPEQRLVKRRMGSASSSDDVFSPNPTIAAEPPSCVSASWSWQGKAFWQPLTEQLSIFLPASGGKVAGRISGSHPGGDGGDLRWAPLNGPDQILRGVRVRSLYESGGGVVALLGETALFRYSSTENNQAEDSALGLEGEAYAVQAIRDETGHWGLKEVARLPRGADDLISIGTDLYAAWSSGRVVVFSPRGILGLATCIGGQMGRP